MNLISNYQKEDDLPELNDIYISLISYFLSYLVQKTGLVKIPELTQKIGILIKLPSDSLRKIAKTYLMKRLYNATARTASLDLLEYLNARPEFAEIKVYYNEAHFIVNEFESYLRYNDFKELFKFTDEITKVWKATLKFNLERKHDLIFRNDKIESVFDYRSIKKKMIQCSFLNLEKPIELVHKIPISNPKRKLSPKNISSFLAHFVHTLDSAILATTVIAAKNDKYLSSILNLKGTLHDCFASSLGSRIALNRLYGRAYSFVFLGPEFNIDITFRKNEMEGLTTLKDILGCFTPFYEHLKAKTSLTKSERSYFLFLDSYFNENAENSYKKRMIPVFKKLNNTALLV